jgi:hypothetical protein
MTPPKTLGNQRKRRFRRIWSSRHPSQTFSGCKFGSVIAVLVMSLTLSVLPAGATTTTVTSATPQSSNTVTLTGQTDWNTGTNAFNLSAHVTTTLGLDDGELDVTVYDQVHSRSQFEQSMQNKLSGDAVILERHTLSEVMQPDGDVAVSLPIQDPTQKRYYLKDAGIYPVAVELRASDTNKVLSRFVTFLINEPSIQSPAKPLGVTTILPVQTALSTNAKNPLSTPDNGALFETVSKALDQHAQFPVTTLAEPESLERLTDTNNSAATKAVGDLKDSIKGRPVARTTWAPIPASLYASDTAGEVTQQLNRGTSVLNSDFTNVDSQDWIVTDQTDTTSLEALKTQGFSRVIVPENDLSALPRSTTLERPFSLSLGKGKTMPAGMADQTLAGHFSDPGGPILGAHRMLADLAVLWNDLPGNQRSVVVMPPRNWRPDAGFLETYFRGISQSPVLQAQTLDQYFDTPTDKSGSTTLVRTLTPISKAVYASLPASRVTDTRKTLSGLVSLVNADNTTLDRLQQQLLLAERVNVDTKTREAALAAIKGNVDHEFSLIQMPPQRSIRLTARQGQIPISIQNDTGFDVHVQIELTSNKLEFPQGAIRTVDLTRQHVTEGFAIDARTSGAFPLQVRLISPDGQTVLERSTITIHSTATSAIGVGLSIGAGAFLVIWWVRSAIKTRRKKRQTATIPQHQPAA